MNFSVILNAYDTDMAQRHMTMACLAAIRKFTDGDYEIIVVDNEPIAPIRDEYKVLAPLNKIEVPLETVYASYNRGAAAAKTDKLFFIQSDVFVHELTLNKLSVYLDEWDMVFPQQIPISREDVKGIYIIHDGDMTHIGQRDAGLLGITRDAFDRTGGWDERFRNLLGEAAFYSRCDDARVTWIDRTNAFITHIMAGNNLRKEAGLYNEEMAHDAKLLEEYR
jgi:hypothetical protein